MIDSETFDNLSHMPRFYKSPLDVLQNVFGYPSFRGHQEAIIQSVLLGHDVLTIMPTGAGKSLCYQIPALLQEGCALIISPLISLMMDQVMVLRQLGLSAVYWNSTLDSIAIKDIIYSLKHNVLKFLYVSPERAVLESFLSLLKGACISFLAIDEAHCISEWGHDFRPVYRRLIDVKEALNCSVIALTATATNRVKQDIMEQLSLSPDVFQSSFDRKNLFYDVRVKKDSFRTMLSFLRQYPDESGIIYCRTRRNVELLVQKLLANGFDALPYHAGLLDSERIDHQKKFIYGEVTLIVATIAFGMGIDKPDIRFVIHYSISKTIENYYQETGRAGRDGMYSHCLLFYSYADVRKYERFFYDIEDPLEQKRAFFKLKQASNFAFQRICRRKQLLGYFGESYAVENCQMCDVCMNPPEVVDRTVLSQKILSCVYRVRSRFGINTIIDVLKGVDTPMVKKYSLNNLSVYGVEKRMTRQDIRRVIDYLIHSQFLLIVGEDYPILKLPKKAALVLKGEQSVYVPVIEKKVSKPDKRSKDNKGLDLVLLDVLKALRAKMAQDKQVPPYVIFYDRTLKEIATKCPKTKKDLSKIYGIGENKLRTFGDFVIDAVHNYIAEKEAS